jgi:uncharacterized protein YxeA
MKYIVFVLAVLFCSRVVVVAQDADSVTYTETESGEPEYQEETTTDNNEYNYDEYSDDGEEEAVPHTLKAPDELSQTKQYQEEKLPVKKFDEKKWKKIIGNTDYNEEPPEPEKKQKSDSREPMSFGNWDSDILRVIAYVCIIGVIIFILYAVTKNIKPSSPKLKLNHETDATAHVESIEDLDVNSLLRKTITDGNFRLAVRLYFLGLLKELNEQGIILWKKDKTNHDYLSELSNKDFYYDEVRKLTLAYEQVWYGEHRLTTESYQQLFAEFENLHQKFNTQKAS